MADFPATAGLVILAILVINVMVFIAYPGLLRLYPRIHHTARRDEQP